MAQRLPHKHVAIIGLGWTGSILANELTDAGLDVVAIERGPWRDTATDFSITYAQDELRYRLQHELFLRPAQITVRSATTTNRPRCRCVIGARSCSATAWAGPGALERRPGVFYLRSVC
jgi:choline dehydrogenase-like flavoprotein